MPYDPSAGAALTFDRCLEANRSIVLAFKDGEEREGHVRRAQEQGGKIEYQINFDLI